jgi:cellulose synthase/poly-beta-1,6-N-acetylglucosamine synthase-like glycosyltransferase
VVAAGAAVVLGVVVGLCCLIAPPAVPTFLLASTAFNLLIGATEARWRLYGWREPGADEQIAWPDPVKPGDEQLSFDLIVPLRDEADVIGETLRGLLRQTHPRLHIVVSLCDDDKPTIDAVRAVVSEDLLTSRITIVTGHYANPTKAQQLNRALEVCAGDVVGVIDAEDDVAEDLLVHAEALLTRDGADVVQGGVQLMNLGIGLDKWFQVHNVLEYFFWFTSRMAFHASTGFVPLGGNTVFVRRELLERAGGWPLSITEDCALGVRLTAEFGAKVATAYSASLTTREEAPPSIFNKEVGSLFWQRDRWIRGFIEQFIAGRWLHMPTLKQRLLAGYILATPILQALSFFLLPTAIIVGLVVNTPIALALLLFTPYIPMGLTTATQLIGLHDFCRRYDKRASGWHYASLIFLAPLYQVVLCGAATVAVYKYASGDNTWYKTGRAGEHRGTPTPTPPTVTPPTVTPPTPTPPTPTPPAPIPPTPAPTAPHGDFEDVEGVAA